MYYSENQQLAKEQEMNKLLTRKNYYVYDPDWKETVEWSGKIGFVAPNRANDIGYNPLSPFSLLVLHRGRESKIVFLVSVKEPDKYSNVAMKTTQPKGRFQMTFSAESVQAVARRTADRFRPFRIE